MIHGLLPGRVVKLTFFLAVVSVVSVVAGVALGTPSFAADPRVVVLGFDGADAKLTQQWMDEGKLPNLAKLRAEGMHSLRRLLFGLTS